MSLSWLASGPQQLVLYGMGVGISSAAGVFGRLAAGVMNAHDRVFLQPVLLALPLIGPIAAALFFPESGSRGLFVGLVTGSVLQCAIAGLMVSREIPIQFGALARGRRLLRPAFLRENAQLGTGTALMSISELAINSAAAAIGPGALSQLSVSQRLPQLFQTFVGGVMATAAYPLVADQYIKGDRRAGQRLTLGLAGVAALGGAIAAALLGIFAQPLTDLLAGVQMATDDREAIASMLALTAWQIPFAVSGIMMSRAVIADNNSRVLTYGALGYLVAVAVAGAVALALQSVMWAAGAPVIGYAISAGAALGWLLSRSR